MSDPEKDEFEDKMLEQMAKMFADMGMPIDVDLLQNMIKLVHVYEKFITGESICGHFRRSGLDWIAI